MQSHWAQLTQYYTRELQQTKASRMYCTRNPVPPVPLTGQTNQPNLRNWGTIFCRTVSLSPHARCAANMQNNICHRTGHNSSARLSRKLSQASHSQKLGYHCSNITPCSRSKLHAIHTSRATWYYLRSSPANRTYLAWEMGTIFCYKSLFFCKFLKRCFFSINTIKCIS